MPNEIPFQTLDKAVLHRTFPTCIVGVHPLPEMTTLTPNDDQADISHVLVGALDVPQPSLRRQKGPFDIDSVRFPPLFCRHIHNTLMMLQNTQIKTGKRDATMNDSEVSTSSFKGDGQLLLRGNVDDVAFEVEILEYGLISWRNEVKDRYVRSGSKESLHGGESDIATATGDNDMGTIEMETEVNIFHCGVANWHIIPRRRRSCVT